MSNGYIVAAQADFGPACEIAAGFGLDAIDPTMLGTQDAAASALAAAPNVGLLLSDAASRDSAFVELVRRLALSLNTAQLIVSSPEARAAFGFLPQSWPTMSLEQAQTRARAMWQQRNPGTEPPRAQPLPPAEPEPPAPPSPEPEPPVLAAPEPVDPNERGITLPEPAPAEETAPADLDDILPPLEQEAADSGVATETFGGGVSEAEAAPPAHEAPAEPAPPPAALEPQAPAPASPPRKRDADDGTPHSSPPLTRGSIAATSAPADATAFAPKKLRRGTPELVRIVIHQPRDLAAVIKAARKIDPRTSPAPSGMSIGEVALGASVGISLEVRGAGFDGALQRRTWTGDAIDFNFSVEPDADVKQAVFLARVFVDDAQIGVLAFTRPVIGANKKAQDVGEKIRLKRHKRVFLSYSSKDRETVAAIATAYQSAGVEHFWDRASLKSGEEWSPRLRREIERSDLFHLCWSKSAASSEWVEKEAEYALTRRRRSNGKKPDITVQMLDGPPWAKHPESLGSINFDDFVRAAIVGYARGDGEA